MSPLDDSEFMTPAEFAGLPGDVHHAVWRAAAAGKVDSVFSGCPTSSTRRYRRAQVLALMRGGEPAPAAEAAGSPS